MTFFSLFSYAILDSLWKQLIVHTKTI